MSAYKIIPIPTILSGIRALSGIRHRRSMLGAMEIFHQELGDVFKLPVPHAMPVMMVGPEANHFLLVTARDNTRWRAEHDPVTRLLRHGILVEDDNTHDLLRRAMNPAFHRRMLEQHITAMWCDTDEITRNWQAGKTYDMLHEMRRIAVLVMADVLYGVDVRPDMQAQWPGILSAVRYIAPGLWVMWPSRIQRSMNYHLKQLDVYLYEIIKHRRDTPGNDLVGLLIAAGLDDDLIRDQLMTLVIAGQDTSTLTLAWALYLLSKHPEIMQRVQAEVDTVLNNQPPTLDQLHELTYLTQVINETMRLYPAVHSGTRIAIQDLEYDGYHIPAGTRVMYSIYLTHRHPGYWPESHRFNPDRFAPGIKHAPYSFLPFGGGVRNCIGAAFAQVEIKVVLARILQRFKLEAPSMSVRPYMGATLKPHPSVALCVHSRR